MYYLLLYGANRVRSVTQRMPRAWGVCAVWCVCVCRRLRVVVDIYSPVDVYRAPRGVSSGFLFISFFFPLLISLRKRRIPSRIMCSIIHKYIYTYRGVMHALVYNTLYYIIIIYRCRWNGGNWLLIIIIPIYIYAYI